MDKEIRPMNHLDAVVTIPGSKSYTQRALVIAALAEGTSVLHHPLSSEDTRYLIEALRHLGTLISHEQDRIIVKGTGGRLATPHSPLYLGNNGTGIRLLISVAALCQGLLTLTGDTRLCERPIKPLMEALQTQGVDIRSKRNPGFPPVMIRASGLTGGRVVFHDIESSQYISSLLISGPYTQNGEDINLEGQTPSLPYIQMTIETMARFGQTVEVPDPHRYIVKGGGQYRAQDYRVEGDVSSASYFFLAAALLKGRVRAENIRPLTLQGDIGMVSLMEELGCSVVRGDHWIELTGDNLKEGDRQYDMGDMPDMVPTLAVLAALRPGRTTITHVSHLRHKESNRLAALVAELNRMGITAQETEDGMLVEGGHPHGAEIETYNDHRIAMAFAVLGLAVPGMTIKNAACVNKSFPAFWDMLDGLSS